MDIRKESLLLFYQVSSPASNLYFIASARNRGWISLYLFHEHESNGQVKKNSMLGRIHSHYLLLQERRHSPMIQWSNPSKAKNRFKRKVFQKSTLFTVQLDAVGVTTGTQPNRNSKDLWNQRPEANQNYNYVFLVNHFGLMEWAMVH